MYFHDGLVKFGRGLRFPEIVTWVVTVQVGIVRDGGDPSAGLAVLI